MLTQKEHRRLKRYEKDFAMSKWKYILIYGVTWGALVFIFGTAADFIFDKQSFQWNFGLVIRFLITAGVGGITFGWFMRKLVMMDYKRLKAKTD